MTPARAQRNDAHRQGWKCVALRELKASEVGLPRFAAGEDAEGEIFVLSSHRRAREALEFGLAMAQPGFNIFVLGEDRSGRMTATFAFLQRALSQRPPPNDWVYLGNFRNPARPRPYRLPAGVGRRFRDRMAALIPEIREAFTRAFGSTDYQSHMRAASERAAAELSQRLDQLRDQARAHGLDLVQTPQGAMVVAPAPVANGAAEVLSPQEQGARAESGRRLAAQLDETNRWAVQRQAALVQWLHEFNRQVADQSMTPLIDRVAAEFAEYPGLARWFTEMRVDMLDRLERFRPQPDDAKEAEAERPEFRYAINLLVDHADDPHPSVVLDANPTYENLFGRIEYRQAHGAVHTDTTLIRAGSLHRANGGILVLRAEALAAEPQVWSFLKGALRDREIRIEEPHRSSAVPMASAPRPKPIPLELKVVIVGAPRWYYAFFSVDPDFQTYFKVKADIDSDMDATPANLGCYTAMIRAMVFSHGEMSSTDGALIKLLGVASRWAGHRDKLTARFELIEDLVSEAAANARGAESRPLTEEDVAAALAKRRRRNARAEDRLQESIARGVVMIEVKGAVVGQINALTVRDLGDHQFGAPSRVTARASVGRRGIINIERDTALGGPIQQKGVMVLQGFLAGRFARRFPLSFDCSITFEQSYGGVEGDSASIAELLAILSDLSGVPLRQDVAVTGSVNQRGQTQAVGGIHHKVEGFFRSCAALGDASPSHGVVLPATNAVNLVLHDEVAAAVEAGRFRIWTAETVEEAIELFTGMPAGVADGAGDYPPDTLYGRVAAQLEAFDRILLRRQPPEEEEGSA